LEVPFWVHLIAKALSELAQLWSSMPAPGPAMNLAVPALCVHCLVHISAVEKAGFSSLNEGQVVEYEEVANKGKTSAEDLKVQR
jgi:hypothetical protein